MKLIAVNRWLSRKSVIGMGHFKLFHGDIIANPSGIVPCNRIENQDFCTLRISRTGLSWPSIIQPSLSLIVNESVKNTLSKYSNILFQEVYFEKLVDFDLAPGDFDCPRVLNRNFLDFLPDSPGLHRDIPKYYELILSNTIRFHRDRPSKIYKHHFLYASLGTDLEEFTCTQEYIDAHPIFWGYATIFHEQVFNEILEHFDSNYFEHVIVDPCE